MVEKAGKRNEHWLTDVGARIIEQLWLKGLILGASPLSTCAIQGFRAEVIITG
jgi:hypothetical protein